MATDRFTAALERALAEVPDDLRRRIDNVAIVVESHNPDDPDIYGLYTGVPLTERTGEGYAGALPDRIEIYRDPLEADFGADPDELAREIRITILHELAHYFGIDEERLDELGFA